MSDLRTAAQQALEALENTSPLGFNMESDKKFFAAITALKAALAEPVQEPPRPFSVDEIRALHKKAWPYCDMTTPDYEFARAIESAHGIKP